jgi:predicted metal-dependent enzyme (double-stranded beta helix superfamily)
MGRELGADFMLLGQIDSILDSAEGESVRFYQVELELIDIETNEKAWIGQKKLKKRVSRKRFRF